MGDIWKGWDWGYWKRVSFWTLLSNIRHPNRKIIMCDIIIKKMKLRGECQTGDLSLKFNSMTVISLHPWKSSHKEKAEKEEERARSKPWIAHVRQRRRITQKRLKTYWLTDSSSIFIHASLIFIKSKGFQFSMAAEYLNPNSRFLSSP